MIIYQVWTLISAKHLFVFFLWIVYILYVHANSKILCDKNTRFDLIKSFWGDKIDHYARREQAIGTFSMSELNQPNHQLQ